MSRPFGERGEANGDHQRAMANPSENQVVELEWSELEAWLVRHGTHKISYKQISKACKEGDVHHHHRVDEERKIKENPHGVPMLSMEEVVPGCMYHIIAEVTDGPFPVAISKAPE